MRWYHLIAEHQCSRASLCGFLMGEMLYQGKVKQVWSTDDPDVLEFDLQIKFQFSIRLFLH